MRRAVPAAARSRSRFKSIAAPLRGLVTAQDPSNPVMGSALVMENWIPTDRGARVRGGLEKKATIGSSVAVKSLFAYHHPTAAALFATSATDLYDISALNASTAPTETIKGLTAGYFSTEQVGVVGGEYLYAVNGADHALLYDGTDWNPVIDVAVNEIAYDAKSTDFVAGETLTGGTSGATATILAVMPTSATEGVLKIGTVTSGPYQDNEALTSASGAATANGANSAASSIAITGVTTKDLSAVWLYRNRLFFVEKNTRTAWYLPVDSLGGAANSISLAGVFQKGGSLLMGATWSIDAGDGLDDKCVFISTEGEVAIYSGSDPSSASTWALEGRYEIAEPLGINATMQAGGDLLIATVDGIIPLSAAIQKDPAALRLSAVSRPIETEWARDSRSETDNVEFIKWPKRSLCFVTLPSYAWVWTVNLTTGAWAQQTGWQASCGEVYDGVAMIGRSDGSICAIDETGYDVTDSYTARFCTYFDGFGDPTTEKVAQLLRFQLYAPYAVTLRGSVKFDFNTDFPPSPGGAGVTSSDEFMIWDVSNWDEKLWWSDAVVEATQGRQTGWLSVAGAGNAMAAQLQITSGQATKPNIEVVRIDMAFEQGGAVV